MYRFVVLLYPSLAWRIGCSRYQAVSISSCQNFVSSSNGELGAWKEILGLDIVWLFAGLQSSGETTKSKSIYQDRIPIGWEKKHYIKDRMEPKENIWDMMTSYRAEVPQVDRSNGPSNLQGHIDKMFPQSRAVRTCCDSLCSLGGPKHHRNILALETWAQHLKKNADLLFSSFEF